MDAENLIAEIHDFWFIEAGPERWWKKDASFDDIIRERFGALAEEAAAGHLDGWAKSAKGALALILLLDQFPRNIHRGAAKAFASDAKARAIAKAALKARLDKGLSDDQRCFFYLPFEHSEDIADQKRCLEHFEALGNAGYLKFATAHMDIIARFGRFPHRNKILGRKNTPEEEEYLKDPKAGF